MGNSNNGCDCVSDENKVQLDGYVDMPALNKEDVNQIWKCFEYLNPTNGLVDVKSLQISKGVFSNSKQIHARLLI